MVQVAILRSYPDLVEKRKGAMERMSSVSIDIGFGEIAPCERRSIASTQAISTTHPSIR
jgi:hypothetical protein